MVFFIHAVSLIYVCKEDPAKANSFWYTLAGEWINTVLPTSTNTTKFVGGVLHIILKHWSTPTASGNESDK